MNFNFESFADEISSKLKGHCGGYAFVVSYKDDWKEKRSYGMARSSNDAPALEMSTSVLFHTASVSKTITGAALLKLLHKRADVDFGTPIYKYLPDHWHIHNDIKSISFRQIMTHTSGLRTSGLDYFNLKDSMKDGITQPPDKPYQGINFALMRLLIPRLAGYSIKQLKRSDPIAELMQASQYADAYIDYVNKELFEKAGLPKLYCNPFDIVTGKCYHFPDMGCQGTNFGDQSLVAGSKGWVMSAAQLAKFFRLLNHTENIMPFSLSKTMRDSSVGYDSGGKTGKGNSYYTKGGLFPGKENKGELRTRIIGYGNDVQVALIINSEIKGAKEMDILNNAFDNAIVYSFKTDFNKNDYKRKEN